MTNRKSTLTPAKKKFAEVYAKTDNATKAVQTAFKENNYSPEVARVKGSRLLTNDNVSNEIEAQKLKMEKIANKAVERIAQLTESDNEQIATTNAWKVYEQVHGKALSRNVSLTATTSIEDALAEL
jgi:phage terminase small subunit